MSGWIGVDLDGTLAKYSGWVSEEHIGEPIPAMVERVKAWRADGREIRIFTARVDGGGAAILLGDENGHKFEDVKRIRGFIETWCEKHIGEVLPITNVKDYGMIELYDDRCVQVEINTGRLIERAVTADPAKCSIIGPGDLDKLMTRYLAGPGLSPDEIEILLFALYAESRAGGGVAAAAYDKLEARKEIEEGKAGIR